MSNENLKFDNDGNVRRDMLDNNDWDLINKTVVAIFPITFANFIAREDAKHDQAWRGTRLDKWAAEGAAQEAIGAAFTMFSEMHAARYGNPEMTEEIAKDDK